MMARYSRAETLFGISSSPVHHSNMSLNSDDENEFKEEDVWNTDARGHWPEEESTQVSSHMTSYGGGGGGGHVNHHHHHHRTTDSGESFRFFNNGRRWLGLETDPGLSVAFADGGRTLGLSSLSPLKPANSTGHTNFMGTSTNGREGITTTTTTTPTPGRIIATSASRMMPPTPGYQLRETSSCHASSRHQMMHHQSAPVNVPDWTKILGSEKKSVAWGDEYEQDKDDDDGEQEERLPPHELLAREHANSQATTFSVFEGAGRTLKGRDLSRVRNAVLRKTGFFDF